MPLKIIQSPATNFSSEEIPVEFVVLHYTACTLEETLRIFSDPVREVCAHFVIALDGTVHDLGGFWNGTIRKGAHAGKSFFELEGKKWEAFNKYSIGIEIVNANGNLCDYPDAQYEALAELSRHLVARFPALRDPNRVVGHEQIAGFRGKVDPGTRFDWKRFFTSVYGASEFPERKPVLDPRILEEFEKAHGKMDARSIDPAEWSAWSAKLEAFVGKLG